MEGRPSALTAICTHQSRPCFHSSAPLFSGSSLLLASSHAHLLACFSSLILLLFTHSAVCVPLLFTQSAVCVPLLFTHFAVFFSLSPLFLCANEEKVSVASIASSSSTTTNTHLKHKQDALPEVEKGGQRLRGGKLERGVWHHNQQLAATTSPVYVPASAAFTVSLFAARGRAPPPRNAM